jgi:hypothetical protein
VPTYLEYGGMSSYVPDQGAAYNALSAMTLALASPNASLAISPASGAAALPRRAMSALACAPDGRAFMFGGLTPAAGSDAFAVTPLGGLWSVQLSGGGGRFSASVAELDARGGPGPRHGHAMVYLPPALASRLGADAGAGCG